MARVDDLWYVEPGSGVVQVDAVAALGPWEAASLARELLAAALPMLPARPCRYCGTPMIWAKLPSGSGIPLNLGDAPAGTLAVRIDGDLVTARSVSRAAALEPGEHRADTHKATCTRAADFRSSVTSREAPRPAR